MKSRPILFSAPMVRAIIDGSKTQTRRIVKPQPDCKNISVAYTATNRENRSIAMREGRYSIFCPYGKPGDQLWVRECFRLFDSSTECACYEECRCAKYHGKPIYRATSEDMGGPWKPSIFMRREHSRITLEITGIRVERLQEISGPDAFAEGIDMTGSPVGFDRGIIADWSIRKYRALWESINPEIIPVFNEDGKVIGQKLNPARWDANPFVWVIEFKRIKP